MHNIKDVQVDCSNLMDNEIKILRSILLYHDQRTSGIETLWTTYRKGNCYLRMTIDRDTWGVFETSLPNRLMMGFTEFFNMYNTKGEKSSSKFDY